MSISIDFEVNSKLRELMVEAKQCRDAWFAEGAESEGSRDHIEQARQAYEFASAQVVSYLIGYNPEWFEASNEPDAQ